MSAYHEADRIVPHVSHRRRVLAAPFRHCPRRHASACRFRHLYSLTGGYLYMVVVVVVGMAATTEAAPFTLYDVDGETLAEIKTDGSTLKPFLNAIREVVNECKINFTEDGLQVLAVEPSNVLLIDVHIPADAFERYDLVGDAATIGVDVASFRYAIRRARMNSEDTLDLRVQERRVYASVGRGYDDGSTVVTDDYVDLIDPDSIRMQPDLPEFESVKLDVSREAFLDATEHADATFTDYLKYDLVDGDLLVTANGDTASSKARIQGVADAGTDAYGLFSTSLLSQNLTAVRKAKADEVSVHIGEQVPIRFTFERTNDDGDVILSGETMLAPRVEHNDDPDAE